jgi:hypothetical protein
MGVDTPVNQKHRKYHEYRDYQTNKYVHVQTLAYGLLACFGSLDMLILATLIDCPFPNLAQF